MPAPAKSTTMTLEETLRQLESLGNAGVRAQNAKSGAGDNQFGVKRGDLRILANKMKTNHELALSLWKTGNIDAQFLATLLIKVDLLSADELEQYNVLLEEQAYPFEEKAIEIHEINAHRVSKGIYDQWVKNSFAALSKLRPVRYAKNEKGEGVIRALR